MKQFVYEKFDMKYKPQFGVFTNRRQERLSVVSIKPSGQVRGAILYHHGIGNHCRRAMEYLQALASYGLHVFAYDMHGCGTSQPHPPDHLMLYSYHNMVDDILDFTYEYIRPTVGLGIPILFSGISLGGAAGALAAIRDKDIFKSLILAAPAVGPNMTLSLKLMNLVKSVALLIIPRARIVAGAPAHKSTGDLDHYHHLRNDSLIDLGNVRVKTAAAVYEGLLHLQKHFHEIITPTYVFVGTEEKVVSVPKIQEFYEGLGTEDKQFKVIEGGWHDLLTGTVRKEVYSSIEDWIDQQLND